MALFFEPSSQFILNADKCRLANRKVKIVGTSIKLQIMDFVWRQKYGKIERNGFPRKMLFEGKRWKSEEDGNFTNILSAAFLYTSVFAALMCLKYWFVIYWQKEFNAKAARKMLVKLTKGWQTTVCINFHLFCEAEICNIDIRFGQPFFHSFSIGGSFRRSILEGNQNIFRIFYG